MATAASFAVLLPAAGSGSRFAGGDKLLTDLAGRSVLQRSVGLFAGRAEVGVIVIATAPERFDIYREHLFSVDGSLNTERLRFAAGGRERWESVLFGLRLIAGLGEPSITHVAVHDAARPLTPAAVIDQAFAMAIEKGAAVPCIAEPATLKKMGTDGMVAATVDRRGLYQAQTPQCFHLGTLLACYEKLLAGGALADVTDDAQVLERCGRAVAITAGDARNLKITTPGDAEVARALLGR